MEYIPRVIDSVIEESLEIFGGVLITGPRASGKTSTGLAHSQSAIRFDSNQQVRQLANDDPEIILEGDTPRLIDEWQLEPNIWNSVRAAIDERQTPGQFILSGSSTPTDDHTRHTGIGRIERIAMRTMSLHESGHSTSSISLTELFTGDSAIRGQSQLDRAALATRLIVGGWPMIHNANERAGSRFNQAYIDNLVLTHPLRSDSKHSKPHRLRRTLAALARNTSTEARQTKLIEDIGFDGTDASRNTLRIDLDLLESLYIYEPLPAWTPALRSSSRLRSTPKIHLADPSLAAAALGADSHKLRTQPDMFGFLFESLAIHDLRVYAEPLGAHIYHYRDNTNLEIDAIIEKPGTWAAIEIKLGDREFKKAERNLIKLRDERINTTTIGEPAFLAIISGTEYAYTTDSGVHVIPLAALAP